MEKLVLNRDNNNPTSAKDGLINSLMDAKDIRFAQGIGASIRYANELRAVSQIGRMAPLQSSNLHRDVLTGNLGPTGLGPQNLDQDD